MLFASHSMDCLSSAVCLCHVALPWSQLIMNWDLYKLWIEKKKLFFLELWVLGILLLREKKLRQYLLWFLGNTSCVYWAGEYLLLLYLQKSAKNWCKYFFKCLIQSINEAIQIWIFRCLKIRFKIFNFLRKFQEFFYFQKFVYFI